MMEDILSGLKINRDHFRFLLGLQRHHCERFHLTRCSIYTLEPVYEFRSGISGRRSSSKSAELVESIFIC